MNLEKIIQRLKDNDPALTELDLSNNKIGSLKAIAIAMALKKNTKLKKLDLRNNKIGSLGAIALLKNKNKELTLFVD